MINELLTQLGLTGKEIAVYLTLLQHGKAAPPLIARITKINRTTVYSVTQELIEKGLITEDISTKPNSFIPKPPEELKLLIDEQQRKLYKKQNIVERLVPELHALAQQTAFTIPKIRFIPEVDLNDFLFKQTPAWDESCAKTDFTWWGFQDPHFAPAHEKWLNWYWKREGSEKFVVKVVTTETEKSLIKGDYKNRGVKFLKDAPFDAAIWAVGNYIVMIMSNQKPNYLLEIHDAVLARNMREYFKAMWEKID